jgi:ribose-phosphate pyrophosphokinase
VGARWSLAPPLIFSCRSGDELARRIAAEPCVAGWEAFESIDWRFPDGEGCVVLPTDPTSRDAFVVQCLHDPRSPENVDQNLMTALLAAKALREAAAGRVWAVLPHLAYARQDRPTAGRREPVSARLIADLLSTAGFDAIVTWHLPTPQLAGFFSIPIIALDPVPLIAHVLRSYADRRDVAVAAPDHGAAELARRIGDALRLPCVYVTKHRDGPDRVHIWSFDALPDTCRTVLLVDDLVSTGCTVEAVERRLREDGTTRELVVVASHFVPTEETASRLARVRAHGLLRRIVVTSSVPTPMWAHDMIEVVPIHAAIARAMARLTVGPSESLLERDAAVPRRATRGWKARGSG